MIKLLISALLLIPFNLIGQGIIINEIVSSNSLLFDEDGETPDWIELYNSSDSSIYLGDYFLSDDPTNLLKWNLPAINLAANNYLTIFASEKDKRSVINWNTIIDQGDTWQYTSSSVSNDWINSDFDDSAWLRGASGIGYGDDDDATIDTATTIYLRHSFTLSDTTSLFKLMLHIDFDDAYVAYLNGIEVSRNNIGTSGTPPYYDQLADTYIEARIYRGLAPEQNDISNYIPFLILGENILAVEVHNHDIGSSDLSIIPFLTLGFSETLESGQGANPILQLEGAVLHSNFKIKATGEDLFLANVGGDVVDSLMAVNIAPDYSYGRKPDGSNSWYYFAEPTFGLPNLYAGYAAFSDSINVSIKGGFFQSGIGINLSTESGSGSIYYTLDGSTPDSTSDIFNTSINISNTTVLRARCFEAQKVPSPELIETYFINEQVSLPVISLVTDPYNLWDENDGMYTFGSGASSEFPYFGANFWEDWEKPAHITLFDENRVLGFGSNCGIKVFGGWSRGQPQRSLSVFFRGKYGNSELDFQLFPELEIDKFQSFVLRNSGNDWGVTMFRDGFMQALASGLDIDKLGYRPSIVYLNGSYWGIHNIREKVNEHYVSSHSNIDPVNVNLLENNAAAIHGSSDDYEQIIDYIQNNNMQLESSYNYIDDRIDINEYLNYMCIQIYIDNTDWPGNNIKYWRSDAVDGKWRWILYDTDFGFSMFDNNGKTHNTLSFALENNSQIDWPNPPWSTLLLRKLLENEKFKNQFINRFKDLLNSRFKPSYVLAVLDSIESKIDSDIDRHLTFWENNLQYRNEHLLMMRTFANTRESNMRIFLLNQFSLSGEALVKLNANSGGTIQLNSLEIKSFPWQDYYFNNIPITLTAIPKPEYTFNGWTGDVTSDNQSISIDPNMLLEVTANFEHSGDVGENIIINEINYNSSISFDPGDWIELYNNGSQNANLEGWILRDNDITKQYIFPNVIVNSDSYLVVVKSDSLFSERFPAVNNFVGEMDFGLSGSGDNIFLYNRNNILIDSVKYSNSDPWPTAADGSGRTLELVNPSLENNLANNWRASGGFGTPGSKNSVFIVTAIDLDKNKTPESFSLGQNFPNPFNPSTTIKYTLAGSAKVELKIFDIKGQKIQTIVAGHQSMGEYKINISTNNLASGIYFFSIYLNGKHFKTRKMVKIQ